MLLYDGAMVGAAMDGGAAAAKRARAMAEELLDASGAAARPTKRASRARKH